MRIYIKPTTKERPRFNTSTGRAFTTNKTKGFEEALRWEYVKNNGKNFQDRFIEVDLIFAFIPPKSWSKKKVIKQRGRLLMITFSFGIHKE